MVNFEHLDPHLTCIYRRYLLKLSKDNDRNNHTATFWWNRRQRTEEVSRPCTKQFLWRFHMTRATLSRSDYVYCAREISFFSQATDRKNRSEEKWWGEQISTWWMCMIARMIWHEQQQQWAATRVTQFGSVKSEEWNGGVSEWPNFKPHYGGMSVCRKQANPVQEASFWPHFWPFSDSARGKTTMLKAVTLHGERCQYKLFIIYASAESLITLEQFFSLSTK